MLSIVIVQKERLSIEFQSYSNSKSESTILAQKDCSNAEIVVETISRSILTKIYDSRNSGIQEALFLINYYFNGKESKEIETVYISSVVIAPLLSPTVILTGMFLHLIKYSKYISIRLFS